MNEIKSELEHPKSERGQFIKNCGLPYRTYLNKTTLEILMERDYELRNMQKK